MGLKVLIGAGLALVVAALMWVLLGSITGSSNELAVSVRSGDFVVSVQASGKLESGLAVRVEGKPHGNILTYLAPEGTVVKKDDTLARFDDTSLRDKVLGNRNDLKMSEAKLAQAREQMSVRKQELAAQVTMLEADLAIKSTQYEQLKSLPHPDDVTRARLDRDYRKSCMDIARQDYEIVQSLSGKGTMIFSKEDEREKELALVQAKGDYEKAENTLKQVLAGSTEVVLDAARRDLAKARIDLDEAKASMPGQITVLEAAMHSAEAEVDKMKARLDQTQKDLDALEVKAPSGGVLVYRTMDGQPLQLGAQFWHSAHLFDITDLDNMVLRAKVTESEYSHIHVGQAVRIRAFSLPDHLFEGEVREVAKVAKDKSEGELTRWGFSRAGIQTFDVLIGIRGSDPNLRPNIDAEATIFCDRIPGALSIPIDAVFEQNGRTWVRVLEGFSPKRREVTLGVYASDWVQVTKGLRAGERVLLKPPEKEGS
jgi:multidrug efflux pump subunit AcrA (membrane-fusion protein)